MADKNSSGNLKTDLKNAIEKNMNGELDLDGYAETLSDSIKNFLTRQEFRIVKLESEINVEHIRTTESIPVDVSPDTLFGPYGPVINALKSLGVNIETPIKKAISFVTKGGASANIDSRKDGGSNGNIKLATGHAYIGEGDVVPDSDTTESDNDFTEVRLMRVPRKLK